MSNTDSIDDQLITLLVRDARKSSNVLAKQLKVSSATIRRRIKKLISSETLNIIGVVDPVKIGFPLTAVINLDVSHDKLESTLELLIEQPEIRWASTTTGRFDILAIGWFRSVTHLHEFIANKLIQIQGLKDSETSICLDIKKDGYVKFPL